jgi:hypothetical protein
MLILTSRFLTDMCIMVTQPSQATSELVVASSMRSIRRGVLLIFTNGLYRQICIGWMLTSPAIIALIFAPMLWVCCRPGEKWRRYSRRGHGSRSEDVREPLSLRSHFKRKVHRAGLPPSCDCKLCFSNKPLSQMVFQLQLSLIVISTTSFLSGLKITTASQFTLRT